MQLISTTLTEYIYLQTNVLENTEVQIWFHPTEPKIAFYIKERELAVELTDSDIMTLGLLFHNFTNEFYKREKSKLKFSD